MVYVHWSARLVLINKCALAANVALGSRFSDFLPRTFATTDLRRRAKQPLHLRKTHIYGYFVIPLIPICFYDSIASVQNNASVLHHHSDTIHKTMESHVS